jgi:hypothetical protein
MLSQLLSARPCRINELSSGFVGSHQTLTTHCEPIEDFTLYRKVVVIHRRCAERSSSRGMTTYPTKGVVYHVYKSRGLRRRIAQSPVNPTVEVAPVNDEPLPHFDVRDVLAPYKLANLPQSTVHIRRCLWKRQKSWDDRWGRTWPTNRLC